MPYWNSLIVVCYTPDFSKAFIDLLRQEMSPEMKSEDAGAQYHIDQVQEIAVESKWSIARDLIIILEAQRQNVEYFEF